MPKPSFPVNAEGLKKISECRDVRDSLSNLESTLASMRSLADAAELLAEATSSDEDANKRLSAIYTLTSLIADYLGSARSEVETAYRVSCERKTA